jgi:hypothetical protein
MGIHDLIFPRSSNNPDSACIYDHYILKGSAHSSAGAEGNPSDDTL